jgi:hypothetical protein
VERGQRYEEAKRRKNKTSRGAKNSSSANHE